MMKSRLELESEAAALVFGRNMMQVAALLQKHFRVDRFARLDIDELARAVELIKQAIYTGEIK